MGGGEITGAGDDSVSDGSRQTYRHHSFFIIAFFALATVAW